MIRLFGVLLDMQRRGEDCVLFSIVSSRGSTPRGAGSHMLVGREGRIAGTIGGGAVEGRCIAQTAEVLSAGTLSMQEYVLSHEDTTQLGMICGGRVTVFARVMRAGDVSLSAVCTCALERIREGKKTWLVENVSHGGVSLVWEGGACGAALPSDMTHGLSAQPTLSEAGGVRYYSELIVRDERVWIFGGGHVAQALVPLLASLDFRCVVIEDRAMFADPALFPGAHAVRLMETENWEQEIAIGAEDCVCIMTRGHQNDLACQAFALKSAASYIGVIGSRRKVAATREKLSALGFSDAEIARIISPIGLDIGAVTPAEIAVSIAAQLIAHRAARVRQMK